LGYFFRNGPPAMDFQLGMILPTSLFETFKHPLVSPLISPITCFFVHRQVSHAPQPWGNRAETVPSSATVSMRCSRRSMPPSPKVGPIPRYRDSCRGAAERKAQRAWRIRAARRSVGIMGYAADRGGRGAALSRQRHGCDRPLSAGGGGAIGPMSCAAAPVAPTGRRRGCRERWQDGRRRTSARAARRECRSPPRPRAPRPSFAVLRRRPRCCAAAATHRSSCAAPRR
jgi:hypothetical protein